MTYNHSLYTANLYEYLDVASTISTGDAEINNAATELVQLGETGMSCASRTVRVNWARGKHRVPWKHESEPPEELAGNEGE